MNKPKLKRKNIKTVFLICLLLVVLIGGVAYAWQQNSSDTTGSPSTTQNTRKPSGTDIQVPTHSEETEGQTIQVPNNVPTGSVKNYKLITENENYKIRELDGTYTITLYAIINNPGESDSYQRQLRDYKQQALSYLSQKGVNTNKASITYDPAEAEQY